MKGRPGTPRARGGAEPRAGTVRVAIAHDYLTQRGGAERVVLALLRAFPDATIYTTLYDPEGTYPEFRDARIVVSPLNRIGVLRRHHRAALPLLPAAAGWLRTEGDVVVASSSGWAHGFRHPRDARVLVYCHNPARWLYQTETYLGASALRSPQGLALLPLRPFLRRWDRRAAARADEYIANSRVVRERIRRTYGIEADVVAPPYGIDPALPATPIPALADWVGGAEPAGAAGLAGSAGAARPAEGPGAWYLIVSRLLPYKNVREAIEAFRGLPERLAIVGHGPLEAELRAALPANVRLLTGLSDAEMRYAYAHARALVAPSHEDFGLTPLEAGAFGRPTLALEAGGYLDTIDPAVNGAFFSQPTPAAIRSAVVAARGRVWDPDSIRAHTHAFDEPRFHAEIRRRVAALAEAGPTRETGSQQAGPRRP